MRFPRIYSSLSYEPVDRIVSRAQRNSPKSSLMVLAKALLTRQWETKKLQYEKAMGYGYVM